MATGRTDANGNFSLGGQKGDWFGDLPDPYVQVRAYSDAVKVNTPTIAVGSSTYCFRSGNYENLGTQSLARLPRHLGNLNIGSNRKQI